MRRAFVRPVGLGTNVSIESIVIALFIATLMITFLLTFRLRRERRRRAGELVGARARHPGVPGADPGVEAPPSGAVADHGVPEVAGARQRAEPRLREGKVGLETVKDLGSKSVLDAFTCVECGRCQVNCPAWGAGKELNPKTIILQTQDALLAGSARRKLGEVYSEKVLWQCTTCGACENQCPVGIEHLPIIIGSRRGLVSNGDAPDYLGAMYNNLERRGNIWGLGYDQRQKFVAVGRRSKRSIRRSTTCSSGSAAPARSTPTSRSRCARCSGFCARRGVRFGVLSKERCTGDPAKRTGNEYMFQELANGNIEDLKAAGPKKILTSCPHCVKTIGDDYRQFGYEVEIVHSSVFVEELHAQTVRRRRQRERPRERSRSTIRAISAATPARSTSRARC